ncbi:hypothetical protein UJ101_01640 [Flavobacteriaceae bacterium UJ101]|nr:hypothetical protein UJ101_01640 [Flavobacteriaceae bacterium UJ101]
MDFKEVKKIIDSLKDLILKLDNQDYVYRQDSLSGSTIGEHSRHIIELFQCLEKGYSSAKVSYDDRKRNSSIQENTKVAFDILEVVKNSIIKEDKPVLLKSSFGDIQTSYYREVLYCVEHCIHHQALIRVALIELGKEDLIDNQFGVAPSTLKHRNNVHA